MRLMTPADAGEKTDTDYRLCGLWEGRLAQQASDQPIARIPSRTGLTMTEGSQWGIAIETPMHVLQGASLVVISNPTKIIVAS
jgi:hypothetical protein